MKIKKYNLIGSFLIILTLTSFSYIFNSKHDSIITRFDNDETEILKIEERDVNASALTCCSPPSQQQTRTIHKNNRKTGKTNKLIPTSD